MGALEVVGIDDAESFIQGGFNFTAVDVNQLHTQLNNSGFYPGENAYYLRFLENHDEQRIAAADFAQIAECSIEWLITEPGFG